MEYHRRSAVALLTSLKDPSERHQPVTMHLLTHQVTQLKALATTFLSTREGTSLPIKRQKSPPPEIPPLPTLATFINCITKPFMDLGIPGFHDLTSANEKYIVFGKHTLSLCSCERGPISQTVVFSRRVFLFRQKFSFSQSYRFFSFILSGPC